MGATDRIVDILAIRFAGSHAQDSEKISKCVEFILDETVPAWQRWIACQHLEEGAYGIPCRVDGDPEELVAQYIRDMRS